MNKFFLCVSVGILLGVGIFLISCAQPKAERTWQQAMTYQHNKWAPYAQRQLKPYFDRAGVNFPPKDIAFLVFKHARVLELYAKNKSDDWVYIRTYPILAASGGYGPKLKQGDKQVPEGIYHISGLNPKSRFDLSLQLNYPNAFDRKEAKLSGRQALGGDIFIHGKQSSIGCVAIGNAAIQQIFPLVHEIGRQHALVIIAPNDFRVELPKYGKVFRPWVPALYADIARVLHRFPMPAAYSRHRKII